MAILRLSRLGLIGLLVLTGCSLSPSRPDNSIPHLKGIGGNIRGGQQPVSGATIQLYTVGTTGDGSAASPMLTSTVTSDANGNFQFGGLFSCTNATQVYLTATGGDPGLGSNNPNLSMMTAIGPCTSITANTFVMIDERTTVAAVSALAHFMGASGSPANIGSSTTDVSALTAAFTLASELVDPSTGQTPGPNVPTGMTVPSTEINTLADALSTCINSAGGVAGDSSACGNLFSLTTPTNGTAPANTIAALLNVASNPTLNTTAIYNLAPATAPFQPELTTAPPDFQIRLTPPASSMALQFSPTSVTFPDQAVGFASAPVMVTITNTGSAAVTISSIGLAGPNASDFSQTNNCTSAPLQPANTCTVQVTITPSVLGPRNGYLSVVSNTPDSPQYIALAGNGIATTTGPVTVSPATLPQFTLAGSSQDITLSNYGSTPLTISSITSNDPSFLPTNNCGTMLAAQSVCTISIQSIGFYYSAPCRCYQGFNGVLTIDDNASTGPQTVQLKSQNTGQVTNPSGSNLNSFDLGTWAVGTSANHVFHFSVGSAYISGSFSGSFTGPAANNFSTSGCSVQLYQGTCSFTVTFTPSAAGVRTATINGVKFTGTGQPAGPSFVASASLMAGLGLSNTNVASGSGTVLVTNNGTTPLSFSFAFSGSNASNFSTPSPGCTTLASGAGCSVNYSFTANSVGTYSAAMKITDTNSLISQTVPLTAYVSYWSPAISPDHLQFAIEPLGVTSAAQTISISDPNGLPLGHPISVSLPASSNFTLPQGSSCPASTTQLCTLSVAFDPHETGSISEFLTATDLTSSLTRTLQMQGTGGSPVLSLSATSITFPARSIGTTSIPVAVTLTNTGTASLNVSQINVLGAVNGNFTETNNCTAVATSGTCSINVTFAPTAAGPQSATIQIISNAASSPDTIAVSGTTN